MKFLIVQLPPIFRHLIPPRSKYSLRTLFSNTPSLCSSLSVRDQVSHPYKTTGRIMVLYILTFTFLESRRDEKRREISSSHGGEYDVQSCLMGYTSVTHP
jgi:hypothetical protein